MDTRPWDIASKPAAEDIEPNDRNISELIDDTRGILLGDTAKHYNQLITDLLYELNRLNKAGALLTIYNGEKDTEVERLRIALTTGELYKRRRGTAYARRIEDLLKRYAYAIENELDEAVKGREGIIHDELEAENKIVEFERTIYEALRGYTWAKLRPGETYEERLFERDQIQKYSRGPLFPAVL